MSLVCLTDMVKIESTGYFPVTHASDLLRLAEAIQLANGDKAVVKLLRIWHIYIEKCIESEFNVLTQSIE